MVDINFKINPLMSFSQNPFPLEVKEHDMYEVCYKLAFIMSHAGRSGDDAIYHSCEQIATHLGIYDDVMKRYLSLLEGKINDILWCRNK